MSPYSITLPVRVHTSCGAPHLLHLLPLLGLRLAFLNAKLLKENIGSIENARRVACVGTFFGAEVVELFRLDFLLRRVVLGGHVPKKLGLSDTRFLQISADLASDFIAGVCYLVSR
jgi:hypothetical protein